MGRAASTFCRAVRAALANGESASADSATMIARASSALMPQGGKGVLGVDHVAAPPTIFGIDRYTRLAERIKIPFQRACADLKVIGQPCCTARSRRNRPQLFDNRIQPIGPIHTVKCRWLAEQS